jgi:hypothetical protein
LSIAVDILKQLEPIGLAEMDSVKLMNRTDTKFLFTLEQFDKIIEEVKDHYRILEVEGQRLNRYKTLYYDTGNFSLYLAHHNGHLNRYKVRHRTYVESNTGFLEVKFKNNKGRTIKSRVKELQPPVNWEGESEKFLLKTQPFSPQVLRPTIWVNYGRYTLVHRTEPERLTIDLNLEFVKDSVEKKLSGLVIAEVKQDKRKASPFVKMMKKYHIREGSISKYCMGIALTCNNVKRNNFKEKLLTLKHLINYDFTADTK